MRSRGQIIKRGEGAYLVRIPTGRDATGKRTHVNQTIRGTKKDAQKFLTAKLSDIDRGLLIQPAGMSLDIYLDEWCKENLRQKVRPQTYDTHISMLAHVRKGLGAKKLSDIKAFDVQKLYNALTEKGLSPRTVRYVHVVLKQAFKHAVNLDYLPKNPCDACTLPKLVKREMKCFTPTQAVALLKAAQESKHYALFRLAIETGLRPGEYLALQWKDIDIVNRRLSVQRALVRSKGIEGGWAFSEPKTSQSRRSVPFSPDLAEALTKHRKAQLEYSLSLGAAYERLDLVFASETGSPLDIKNIYNRHFKKIITAYNERIEKENAENGTKTPKLPEMRLYAARHTMATLLLSDGVNPKIVSERLGHSSIVQTLDTYSHVLPNMQEEASERLASMLKMG